MEMKIKPNLFSTLMYPTVSLEERAALDQLLSVFESDDKFVPALWGNNEMIRLNYNRNELIERVSLKQPKFSEIYLHRDKTVRYSGHFDLTLTKRSFLSFTFDKSMHQKNWSTYFMLSDQIAEIVKPRFGVTHIFWPAQTPWKTEIERMQKWMNLCSYPVPVKFFPNGPLGLGMRTYLGGDVLEMFDREILSDIPAVVTDLSWGGIRIDLAENPWELDSEELLNNWMKVMQHLEKAHLFAIPSFDRDHMGVAFSPNSLWRNYLGR